VTSLDSLPLHEPARIEALHLEPHEATWLRAVGLLEGSSVTVLRKAPWSGPLHVRVADHTELAIDRVLARHVEVTPITGALP
jgi:ferrous iron transport protein A